MRELNNQPHSLVSKLYYFYALLFCFSQHKRLAFHPCNVFPVLQYSILNDIPLGKKKMSAGSRMQGSCLFGPSKSCYFLLK